MNTETFYPLLFTPVLKNYLWGGRNLEKVGRVLPSEGVVAESWEIAGHEDGTSVVKNGRFASLPLTQLHAHLGLQLIGRRNAWAQERGKFPLLIKLLDANQPLSVQVHPNDEYALAHEGNELGKTEMWVVLHAEPSAEVILGIKAGTTPEQFKESIENGRLEPHLHHIPVQTGDHICVPAGSLHAIMGGLLIAEIQQNSNTTYRVYDWNRVGSDGKKRPLHFEKALQVINFDQVEPALCPPALLQDNNGIRRWELCRNRYFVTERVEMAAGSSFSGVCDGETLEIWGVVEGKTAVSSPDEMKSEEPGARSVVELVAIEFTLLPAALGPFTITAHTPATLLRTYVE